eukprot:snap_masked-scaffold_47-processed-gene-1.81-mRNA-1 protein AED:1.00 eAED:1.00 QI:0/0/0/0/1/1/2/0/260
MQHNIFKAIQHGTKYSQTQTILKYRSSSTWGSVGLLRYGEEMRRNRKLEDWARQMFGDQTEVDIRRSGKYVNVNMEFLHGQFTSSELDNMQKKADLFSEYISTREEKVPVFFTFNILPKFETKLSENIPNLREKSGFEQAAAREVHGSLLTLDRRAGRLARFIAKEIEKDAKNTGKRLSEERYLSENTVTQGSGGFRLQIKGRIQGVRGIGPSRKSVYKIEEGTLPRQTIKEEKYMDYGFAEARTMYGMCSIKIWLHKRK